MEINIRLCERLYYTRAMDRTMKGVGEGGQFSTQMPAHITVLRPEYGNSNGTEGQTDDNEPTMQHKH